LIAFFPDWAETSALLISALHIAWDDRCTPLGPAIDWDEVSQIICLDWLRNSILLMSTSQVPRITGICHQPPASSSWHQNVVTESSDALIWEAWEDKDLLQRKLKTSRITLY
jgi:hypothetical protein